MRKALAPPARPSVLIVDGDASLREAICKASDGHDPIEALRRELTSRGYDVVVSSRPEEALLLAQERSFDRIYSDGTLLLGQTPPVQEASSGPIVEDLGDGKARVQIDQVLPCRARSNSSVCSLTSHPMSRSASHDVAPISGASCLSSRSARDKGFLVPGPPDPVCDNELVGP